jgi:hypothetical protein
MTRPQDYGEQMAEAASGGFDSIEDMRADERRRREAAEGDEAEDEE